MASVNSKEKTQSTHIPDNYIGVGRENLHYRIPPHDSYESAHRFDPSATWTRHEERVVVKKTDIYLLGWLCIMFLSIELDRGILTVALADTLLVDIGITSDDYNNGTTIQIVCFLAANFPSQFIIKRFGFKFVLPTMVTLCGIIFWAQAFMTNRTSFYLTRAAMGLCEGGFIPGVVLMATYFYTSRELSTRLAAFWSIFNAARIIASLLAGAIFNMRGYAGRPGWFWLFLLPGLFTFVVGIVSFLYLPRSPTATNSVLCRNGWYTDRDETIQINRILRDDPAKGLTSLNEPATWKDLQEAWTDSSLWGLYFIGLVAYIPATPLQAYLPLILSRIGFTTFQSNMLMAPSAALQIILSVTLSFSSAHFKEWTWHCLFGELWLIPVLTALLTMPNEGREWAHFTLATLATGYPYFNPLVSAWISENTFDVKKRAITAATYNCIVQVGSLIASQTYRSWDSPYFKVGNTVCISISALSVVAIFLQKQYLVRLNAKKEQIWNEMNDAEHLAYQNDKETREKEGNKRLDFLFRC